MKLNSLFFISLLVFLLTNCKPKPMNEGLHKSTEEDLQGIHSFTHDTFRVDPFIQEQADLIMEGQEEVLTFDDLIDKDTLNQRKKSSNVEIIVLRDNVNDLETTDMLRCLANLKNDTLNIDISMNTGFGGKGVSIRYSENNLTTAIYEFTDVIDESKKEPHFTIEKQKLTLHKSNYQVGDSLYGHIYARIIGDETKYYAEGFFRAKITSRK